jgi:putative transposase
VRQTLKEWGYTIYTKSRGEEEAERQSLPGYRARRWVVGRTHSWLNRFRRRLVRREDKPENYLAMLHIACAFIAFRAAGILG